MADQIKQIAFKEFSITETIAGTPFNVQTGATDAYVIKSIEATQGVDTADGAITATATVGLTSDFSSGKYVSLGNVAKQGKVGSTGNIIVDSNSTFTVRPTAKAISFADKTFWVDTESTTETRPRKQTQKLEASVQGTVDINTSTVVDRTAVTFASPVQQYIGGGNAGTYQYTVLHTNANGVHLKILFSSADDNGAGFEVHNATSGVNYGYYNSNYGCPQFDGSRYIFWYDADFTRIHYYDLDESTTNLASANTYGGGNANVFYHGRIALGSGTNPSNNNMDNDHKVADLVEKDGQKYLVWANQAGGNSAQVWMAEIPSTLTNYDASANVANKKIRLWSSQLSSNATDPFGVSGVMSMGQTVTSIAGLSRASSIRVTYDTTLARWLVYFNPQTAQTFIGTFTQAEYDATSSGNAISTANSTGGYGLMALAQTSIATNLGINNGCLHNQSGVGYLDRASTQGAIAVPTGHNPVVWSPANERYWDERKLYIVSETSGAYQYHIYEIDVANSVMTHVTTSITGQVPNYYGRFLMKKSTPSNATAASRSYTSAPKLTVRISGVHENRA